MSDSVTPVVEECPKAKINLYEHVARSGACDWCKSLDGWFYEEEEEIPPYEFPIHGYCRCFWRWRIIEGLWRDQRDTIINKHADISQQYYDAAVEIAAWDDKILERENQLGIEKADMAQQKANAEEYVNLSNQAQDAAQRYMDEFDEPSEEVQDMIDELLLQAAEYLSKSEEALQLADDLQHDVWDSENYISNANDQRDAEVYRRDEAMGFLKEAEPCLNLDVIEDLVEQIAGSRLKMEL